MDTWTSAWSKARRFSDVFCCNFLNNRQWNDSCQGVGISSTRSEEAGVYFYVFIRYSKSWRKVFFINQCGESAYWSQRINLIFDFHRVDLGSDSSVTSRICKAAKNLAWRGQGVDFQFSSKNACLYALGSNLPGAILLLHFGKMRLSYVQKSSDSNNVCVIEPRSTRQMLRDFALNADELLGHQSFPVPFSPKINQLLASRHCYRSMRLKLRVASKVNFQWYLWIYLSLSFSRVFFLSLRRIYFQFFFYEVEVCGIQGGQESFVFHGLQPQNPFTSLIALTCKIHIS